MHRNPAHIAGAMPTLMVDSTRSAMRVVAELEQRLGLFEANITGMEEVSN